ncbi:hypothetical protein EBU99_00175 [bacterium]|nr:hypothetical protein [bacterium]
MPGYKLSALRSFLPFSSRFSLLLLGSAYFNLVGCNGQTAFVEQSRNLNAASEIRVASSDGDALGRRREGPGATQVSGEGSINGESANGQRINENRRTPPPANPEDSEPQQPPVATQPGLPSSQTPTPVASQPSMPSAQPLPPVASQPSLPPAQPLPPTVTPKPAPQPHAGDWVQVQLTQPRAKVDILWVVDDSGSMEWAQNQLKSKFQSFAQKLKDTRIDFQVGITSVDVCQVDPGSGLPVADALCPNSADITSGSRVGGRIVAPLRGNLKADPSTMNTILRDGPDFVQAFQRTALLGTNGSAFEHGLWAAKLAVEKALGSTAENKGFVRPDAALSVVVLSDEEDDSVQMWCEDGYGRTSTTANGKQDLNLCRDGGSSPFLDAFGIPPYALMKNSKGIPLTTHKFTAENFTTWASEKSVKGAGNFRVSAITGLRDGLGKIDCALSSNGPEESGTNYIRAAQLTGGAIENICSSNWSSVLTSIGQNTVELATRVSLPAGQIPFAGTLEVKVDGQVLDAMQYSYDSVLHAVVFKAPPAMGSDVVVSYRETLVD